VYFLWNFVMLGILPEPNSSSFASVASESDMITEMLERTTESTSVIFVAKVFSFFAILSPFMSCTMSFVDFLKDGFKVRKKSYELLVYGLVLIPPTLLTLSYPHLFLKALGFAGGFADVMLFGVLPVLIVWIGRYVKKVEGPYMVIGGKLFLSFILILSISFLTITHLTQSKVGKQPNVEETVAVKSQERQSNT
jgi:tyrosine-specific transport protein